LKKWVVGYINFKSQKLSLLRFARNDMSLIRKIRYQLAWDTTRNFLRQESLRGVTFAQCGDPKWQRLQAAAAEALKPPPLFGHSNTV